MAMTKEELKAALGKLTGESTEPEIISQVDAILEGYTTEEAVTALQAELDAERKRFKDRFWGEKEKQVYKLLEEISRELNENGND